MTDRTVVVGTVEVATDVEHPVVLGGPHGYPAPAGFRIMGALEHAARRLSLRLQITCGSNGHPADDPHSLGEAYDVRSHTFEPPVQDAIVDAVLTVLADNHGIDRPMAVAGGLATARFFGFLEAAGTPNQHFHFQRRKGTNYP